MAGNAKGNLEALRNAESQLLNFKRTVESMCDELESAASSASSFCKDDISRTAIDKLNNAITEIRDALGIVQPALERIRQIMADIEEALQVQM